MLLADEEIMTINQTAEFDSAIGYAKKIIAAYEKKLREQEPVGIARRMQSPGYIIEELQDSRIKDGMELFTNPAPILEWQPIETAPKKGCHLAFDARDHSHPFVIVWLDADHPDADGDGDYVLAEDFNRVKKQRDELLAALEDAMIMIGRIKKHCQITDNAGYTLDGRMLKLTDVEQSSSAAIANTRKAMGKCYYAPDGTLMNSDGTRSIFDDVDQ